MSVKIEVGKHYVETVDGEFIDMAGALSEAMETRISEKHFRDREFVVLQMGFQIGGRDALKVRYLDDGEFVTVLMDSPMIRQCIEKK